MKVAGPSPHVHVPEVHILRVADEIAAAMTGPGRPRGQNPGPSSSAVSRSRTVSEGREIPVGKPRPADLISGHGHATRLGGVISPPHANSVSLPCTSWSRS